MKGNAIIQIVYTRWGNLKRESDKFLQSLAYREHTCYNGAVWFCTI